MPDRDDEIPSIIRHAAIESPFFLVRAVVDKDIGLLIGAEPVEIELVVVIHAFELVRRRGSGIAAIEEAFAILGP